MKSATQIFRIMLQKFIMLFKVNLYASDAENWFTFYGPF